MWTFSWDFLTTEPLNPFKKATPLKSDRDIHSFNRSVVTAVFLSIVATECLAIDTDLNSARMAGQPRFTAFGQIASAGWSAVGRVLIMGDDQRAKELAEEEAVEEAKAAICEMHCKRSDDKSVICSLNRIQVTRTALVEIDANRYMEAFVRTATPPVCR